MEREGENQGGKSGVTSLWREFRLQGFLSLLFVGLWARAVGGGEVAGVGDFLVAGVLAGVGGGGGGKNFTAVRGGGEGREAKPRADGLVAVGELADGGGGESDGLEGGGRLDESSKSIFIFFSFSQRTPTRADVLFLAMSLERARQRAANLEWRKKSLEEGKCRICKVQCFDRKANGKHFKREHKRSFKNQDCPICGEVIPPWGWSYHFRYKHLFTCPYCLESNPLNTHYDCYN